MFLSWKNILVGSGFIVIVTGSVAATDLALWSSKLKLRDTKFADEVKKNLHIKTPQVVKAIYITSATPSISRFEELVSLIKRTELNAIVIDLKDSFGKPAFDSSVSLARQVGISKGKIKDLPAVLSELHQNGIYVIARIVVFQDPALAAARSDLALKNSLGKIWTDRKGVTWVDPASREVWEYNAALGREAAELGFDEINFDYIRFASDGAVSEIRYPFWDGKIPKWEVMRLFYKYLRDELNDLDVPLSADLFGITVWRDDDVNIGQRFADSLPYFDYVSPMLYPSHFPTGFEGWANPANYPYEIYKRSIARAEATRASTTASRATLRPWIQDFDLGADYDKEKVRAEIRGAMEEGATGWMLWNARNVYTEEALEKEEK